MQTYKLQHSSILTRILIIIASLIPLWIAYEYPVFLSDDSYITLTYAKNIANGQGFVFNHPPPTQGTTTPLLTIVVAGLASILPFINIPTLAVFFTAFCWLGIFWVLFLFRQNWDLSEHQAIIVGLVVVASGFLGSLGMEAYLFAFVLVLSLSLFQNGIFFWGRVKHGPFISNSRRRHTSFICNVAI